MTKSIYFPLSEDDLGVVCITRDPALFKLCTREEIDCLSYVFHQVNGWITRHFGSEGEFVYFIRCHNRMFWNNEEFILFITLTYDVLKVEGCVVHQ